MTSKEVVREALPGYWEQISGDQLFSEAKPDEESIAFSLLPPGSLMFTIL